MADVDITPKIRCDNCGRIEDKTVSGPNQARIVAKPRNWGSCRIEGGRQSDAYGGKDRLDFTDLCQGCADAALDAAATALRACRSETDTKGKDHG